MTRSGSAPTEGRPRRQWRITWLAALGLITALLALVYWTNAGNSVLEEAYARIDASDPGWRIEDLEAKRAVIAHDENGALVILKSDSLKPAARANPALDRVLSNLLSPERELNSYQLGVIEAELENLEPALAEARKLADLSRGRFPIVYSADGISTVLPGQVTRSIVTWLRLENIEKAEKGEIGKALLSNRAMLNAGRTLYDEPTYISQLIRVACCSMALNSLERTLAQGDPPPGSLGAIEPILADEEKMPLLLIASRGERAICQRAMECLRSGKLNWAVLGGMPSGSTGRAAQSAFRWLGGGFITRNHADVLDFTSTVVEIAKKPEQEQIVGLTNLHATLPEHGVLVKLLMPAGIKVNNAFVRYRASLRCALVMVALEKYRQANGRWPKSLAELTPAFIPAVPMDPFDFQPLRYKRLADGVVVYSIGEDRIDNGGKLNRANPSSAGSDLGFRLWDVGERRQPPANPEVGPPAPEE
jgi:hypothetical protein